MNPFDSYTNPFDSFLGGNLGNPILNNKNLNTKFVKEEEDPIFIVTSVKFLPPAPICCVVTRNENLVIALKNGHVIWFNLQDSKDRDGKFSITLLFPILFCFCLSVFTTYL
jgi:hypothetical protein